MMKEKDAESNVISLLILFQQSAVNEFSVWVKGEGPAVLQWMTM